MTQFKSMHFSALDDLNTDLKRMVQRMLKAPNLTPEQVLALSDLYTTLAMTVDYKLAIVDKAFTPGQESV